MYAQHVSKKNTAQTEQAKSNQVKNNAGGYVFSLDKWDTLRRFLVLGNEGGSYYCSERKMTRDNAKCVLACASEDLSRTLNLINEMRWKSPKPSPSIFALALLVAESYDIGNSLSKVCKTGTQLFEFVENCNHLRGWGSLLKRVVQNWYLEKDPQTLSYQVTKYQSRNNWSHRDILRLAHPKTDNAQINNIFKYVCQNNSWASDPISVSSIPYLMAVNEAKNADVDATLKLIYEFKIPRECVRTEHLKDKRIWEALLQDMPMIAMLRNLGKMSSIGLLNPFSHSSNKVIDLLSKESVSKSKVHPLIIMTAYKTYSQGRGTLGSLNWTVNQQIIEALDSAFYYAFDNVEPTNKRFYLGIDCSGSMTCGKIGGSQLNPMEAAGVMAMVSVKTEPQTYTAGFNHQMQPINLLKNDSLQSAVNKIAKTPWGATNCALPMIDALQKKIPVDCFIVYTDNETYYGSPHPFQALQNYRQKMGINSKLIVCGMTATNFSIADPSDPGTLDVVGFDTSVPSLIESFVK